MNFNSDFSFLVWFYRIVSNRYNTWRQLTAKYNKWLSNTEANIKHAKFLYWQWLAGQLNVLAKYYVFLNTSRDQQIKYQLLSVKE